jgi:hypothetical protein
MVLVRFGGGICEIRGQVGGVYFKKDLSGNHLVPMPSNYRHHCWDKPPVFANSPGVSASGTAVSFTGCANIWILIIAGVFALYSWWFDTIIAWDSHISKPPKKIKNPYLWFNHFNAPRLQQGLPAYTCPPIYKNRLPEFVITGTYFDYFVSPTQNMYKLPTLYNGKPQYKKRSWPGDHIPHILYWLRDRWIIAQYRSDPPPTQHWYQISEFEEGYYTPSIPGYGVLKVTK